MLFSITSFNFTVSTSFRNKVACNEAFYCHIFLTCCINLFLATVIASDDPHSRLKIKCMRRLFLDCEPGSVPSLLLVWNEAKSGLNLSYLGPCVDPMLCLFVLIDYMAFLCVCVCLCFSLVCLFFLTSCLLVLNTKYWTRSWYSQERSVMMNLLFRHLSRPPLPQSALKPRMCLAPAVKLCYGSLSTAIYESDISSFMDG